jgi:hypothetical protein
MTLISKLKLVTAKRERITNPVILRRNKLVFKIQEQIEIANAKLNGTLFTSKRIKKVKKDNGEIIDLETTKRVKEWFWETDSNKINLSIRYGSKTLVLNNKGANCIEINGKEELVTTLNLIKESVVNGELDEAITKASEKLRDGFTK